MAPATPRSRSDHVHIAERLLDKATESVHDRDFHIGRRRPRSRRLARLHGENAELCLRMAHVHATLAAAKDIR